MKKSKLLIGALLLSGAFAFTSCQISGGSNSTQSQTALPSSEIPSTHSSASTPGAISSSTTPSVPATPSTSSVPSSSSTTPSVPATSSTTPSVPSTTSSTAPTTPTASSTTPSSSSSTTLTYTVEFTTGTTQTIDSQTIEAGDKAEKPTDPTKDATAEFTYAFEGWYTEQSLTNKYDFNTAVNSNLHLYAKFTETKNQYKVKFLNDDDTEVSSNDVAYGAQIVAPETNPTKAATAEFTYTFDGWYTAKSGGEKVTTFQTVSAAVTYYARYIATKNQYTYTFFDEDGQTELKVPTTVDYGTVIVAPTNPTKASTAQYTYAFDGWYTEKTGGTKVTTFEGITSNVTYYARYTETARTYTVVWKNYDGTVLETDTNVEYNATPNYDGATPTKNLNDGKTYSFFGWSPTESKVTSDQEYVAQFVDADATFTLYWVNYNDDVLETDTNVHLGDNIEYNGATPTKPATAQYSYVFKSWATSVDNDTLKITKKAQFDEVINQYTYTFYADNGTTSLKSLEVDYGTQIVAPSNPTKDSTAQYTYAFDGWYTAVSGGTKVTEFPTITENVTYYARFNLTIREYTITWKNDDNSTINTTSVAYGTTPTHANPSKAATAEYTYTFAGWTPTIASVTGEATYKATYNSVKNKYTYTFYDEDGTTPLKALNVDYGTQIQAPVNPTKAEDSTYTYEFEGWYTQITGGTKVTSFPTITSNVTYYARYTQTAKQSSVDSTAISVDTAYSFTGSADETGDVVVSGKYEGNSGTVSKLTIDATSGKLNVQTGSAQVNAETVLSFSTAASANITITLHSYNYADGIYSVTAPGVDGVLNDARIDTFTTTGAGNVSIAFNTNDTYIIRLEVDITGTVPTPATTYSITYVTEHGTVPANKTNVTEITSADLPELSASGYTFNGWYTNEARTNAAEAGALSGNVTLYAKWTQNQTPVTTYSITYVTEHGTAPANKTNVTEITSSDLAAISASGYVFEGWFTNEARTVAATAGALSANVTLYAKWTAEILDPTTIHENTALQFHNNDSGISNVVIWSDNTKTGTQSNFTVSGSETYLQNSGYLEFKHDIVVSFDLQIPSGKSAVLKTSFYNDFGGTVKIDSGSAITGSKSGASSTQNYIYTYDLASSGNVTLSATSSQNYLNWIAVEFIDASVTITALDVSYMRIAQTDNSDHGNGVYKATNAKTVYKLNEAFDSSGIYGVATYSDSSTEVLYGSSLTYTGFDSTAAGEQTVTVSYTLNGSTQSTTFKIYVVSAEPAINNNVLQVKVNSSYTGTIGANNGGFNTFKTINQALDFLRTYKNSATNKLLYIESGTYNEKLWIDIPNLTIRGANKTDTIIEYNTLWGRKEADGFTNVTDSTQTMTITDAATNCILYDITVSNYWNSYSRFVAEFGNNSCEHRALALLIYADKVVVQDCRLLGYQDTLEAMTGRSYFLNSYISGATDFIFGTNPTMYFKNCEIRSIYNGSTDGGYINAFKGINKNSSDYVTFGVIYDGCTFTKDDNVTTSNTAIARPWDYYSNVMIMNSELDSHISKTAYTSGTTKNQRYVCWTNGGQVAAQPTSENVHFYEYNNNGTGALTSAVNGMTLVNSSTAVNYNNLATIYGSANGYSSDWTPTIITESSTHTITVSLSSGYVEGAYVEFETTADTLVASYKKSTDSDYTTINSNLIRMSNGVGRVDVVGLSAGTYSVKLVDSFDSTVVAEANNLAVTADDRNGYAHFDNSTHTARSVAVGAYNIDGTLKTDADVIYVTDTNKNTVTYKGYTGLGEILAHASSYSNPLAIRIIGTIRTTQWNSKSYSGYSDKAALAALVVESYNGATSSSGKYYAADLIAANANSYSVDLANGITTLDGLTSYGTSSDSYWNMMDVQNANNITIEGIGIDAGIFQWGFTFSKCNKIEVKNLTFDHYTEDAIGIQGGSNNDMNYGNFWIHNCTFYLGVNNWDVSDDQDKSDGDGSTDFKYAHNLTISYCTYNHTHKTNLIGANNAALQYNITLHHNFYNGCSQRLPLMRQANVHMYNNYYYGNSFTGISVRAKANAFIENSYFNGKNPYMLAYAVKDSVDPVGTTIKAIGNVFDSTSTTITGDQGFGFDANGIYVLTTSGSNDPSSYSANTSATRTTTASDSACNPTGGSTSYANFDTNSELFYYTGSASDVTRMDNASELPNIIPGLAGAGLKGGTYTDTILFPPLTEYTLSYNENGHGTAPSSSLVAVISNSNLPTISTSGYIFDGWYNEASCTNKVTVNTVLNGSKIIYAKWIESYTLTYNENGHGTAPAPKGLATITSSDLPSLTANGYTFGGWYYEAACTNKVTAGTALDEDKTIYAKWIDNSSITKVVFDPSNLTQAVEANISTSVTYDGFTIVGTADKAIAVYSGTSFTYGGTNYNTSKSLSMGGSASFNSYRYIEFTLSSTATVTIVAKSSASSDRTINMVSSAATGTVVTTFTAGASQSITTRNDIAAGTYRVGSANSGIYIYAIIIEYTNS